MALRKRECGSQISPQTTSRLYLLIAATNEDLANQFQVATLGHLAQPTSLLLGGPDIHRAKLYIVPHGHGTRARYVTQA